MQHLVRFRIPSHRYLKPTHKRGSYVVDQSYADLITYAFGESANNWIPALETNGYEYLEVICTPIQFCRFIIARESFGFTNYVKELQAGIEARAEDESAKGMRVDVTKKA